jgi:hypothetical protein
MRSSASLSSTVCGSVSGTPGMKAAGTGRFRQDNISMASDWASLLLKLKLGITVSATRARGSLKWATCQANDVFCPDSRPNSYCSASLSPT